MPKPLEYTPIQPASGGVVHSFDLRQSHKTTCGRICAGWIVALAPLGCQRCKELIHLPVAPAAQRRRVAR